MIDGVVGSLMVYFGRKCFLQIMPKRLGRATLHEKTLAAYIWPSLEWESLSLRTVSKSEHVSQFIRKDFVFVTLRTRAHTGGLKRACIRSCKRETRRLVEVFEIKDIRTRTYC